MNYCILRVKKLKSFGAIVASCRHTFREMPTANADAARTASNETVGAKSSYAVAAAFRSKLPERRRKDAVLGLEYLITASPEFFADGQRRTNYFASSLNWLKERHGASNVVSASVHRDETTPHLVVYVLPLTADGRLSAKEYCGGAKKLSKLQTDFHVAVAKQFGLTRGIQGSRAKHQTLKKFYAGLRTEPTPPELGAVDHLVAAVGLESRATKDRRAAEEALLQRGTHAGVTTLSDLRAERAQARAEAVRLEAELVHVRNKASSLVRRLRQKVDAYRMHATKLVKDLANALEALAAARSENARQLQTMKTLARASHASSADFNLSRSDSPTIDRSKQYVR